MKLLLTSAGIKNACIERALVELLGKPIADSSALCVPTAGYAAAGGAQRAHRLITGTAGTLANAVTWAAGVDGPAYAIDDQTAIRVTDGPVEVISEGHWQHFGG